MTEPEQMFCLCSGSPAAEPPAAQHIILYTHTLKHI